MDINKKSPTNKDSLNKLPKLSEQNALEDILKNNSEKKQSRLEEVRQERNLALSRDSNRKLGDINEQLAVIKKALNKPIIFKPVINGSGGSASTQDSSPSFDYDDKGKKVPKKGKFEKSTIAKTDKAGRLAEAKRLKALRKAGAGGGKLDFAKKLMGGLGTGLDFLSGSSNVIDIANDVKGFLPDVGKLGLKGLGSKIPLLGSALDVGTGVYNLASGERQKEMPSGLDMLSPMSWGKFGGEKINETIESNLGDSVGGLLYSLFNPEKLDSITGALDRTDAKLNSFANSPKGGIIALGKTEKFLTKTNKGLEKNNEELKETNKDLEDINEKGVFRKFLENVTDAAKSAGGFVAEKASKLSQGAAEIAHGIGDKASKMATSVIEGGKKAIGSFTANTESSSGSLADIIKGGESGKEGYNAYNRGTVGKTVLGSVGHQDLENMTIAEIMRRQKLSTSDTSRLFAVGKYQMIPDTLKGAVEKLGIDPETTKFDKQTQEMLFSKYLLDAKRPQIAKYIKGKGGSAESAQLAAAQEWASIAAPGTNSSVYGHGNKASISSEKILGGMNKAKALYDELRAKGFSEDEAYQKAVTGNNDTISERTKTQVSKETASGTNPAINNVQLKLKSAEATAGGEALSGTTDLAKLLQSKYEGDIKYFSAFNDAYHKSHSPESGHTKGLKFDMVLNDPKKAEEMKANIEQTAQEVGVPVKVLNEYAHLSAKGTGGHLDVGFRNEEEAQKFSQLLAQKQSTMQPKPSEPKFEDSGSIMTASAREPLPVSVVSSASSLSGNQKDVSEKLETLATSNNNPVIINNNNVNNVSNSSVQGGGGEKDVTGFPLFTRNPDSSIAAMNKGLISNCWV